MNSYEFPWVPMNSHGSLWIPMNSLGFLWIPKDFYGLQQIVVCLSYFCVLWLCCLSVGVSAHDTIMTQAPWNQQEKLWLVCMFLCFCWEIFLFSNIGCQTCMGTQHNTKARLMNLVCMFFVLCKETIAFSNIGCQTCKGTHHNRTVMLWNPNRHTTLSWLRRLDTKKENTDLSACSLCVAKKPLYFHMSTYIRHLEAYNIYKTHTSTDPYIKHIKTHVNTSCLFTKLLKC
jgi:hypothetical protein